MADGQSVFETPVRSESLLDVVLDKLQKAGKTAEGTTARLIYVARFARRESNADQLKAVFTKLADKHYQEGEVTGLLLCFPTCMAHLLEAKTPILMAMLRDLQSAGVAEHHAVEARVISSIEDIPVRCFNGYHVAYINTASSVDTTDAADSTTIIKAASELSSFMRGVGAGLLGLSEMDLKRRLSTLDSYHDDMPAPELLLSLCPAEDAPTIEEYLELFDSPISIDLDSERVWPMPVPVR